jgi:hypothetical protein
VYGKQVATDAINKPDIAWDEVNPQPHHLGNLMDVDVEPLPHSSLKYLCI